MSMRSIFSGHLKVGLLSVPIKVYGAYDNAENIQFNQLHAKCTQKINLRKVCVACNELDLKPADLVKGYEHAKGQFAVITQAEVDALKVESTHTVNVTNFVDPGSINPLALDKAYYVGPDTKTSFGKQAFATLRKAMSNRVGIGKIAMYGKEQLTVIRAQGLGIVMQTMLRPEELRSMDAIEELQPYETNPDEVAMAEALVVQFTKPFDFSTFRDEYTESLRQMVDAKVKGTPFVAPAAPQPQASTSLLDALKASLGAAAQATKTVTVPAVPEAATGKRQAKASIAKPSRKRVSA